MLKFNNVFKKVLSIVILLGIVTLGFVFIGRKNPKGIEPVSRRYDVTLRYSQESERKKAISADEFDAYVQEVVQRSQGEIKFYGKIRQNQAAFLLSQNLAPQMHASVSEHFQTESIAGQASWNKVVYHPMEQKKLPEKRSAIVSCKYDSDCVAASAVCGCGAGGSVKAIHWEYYNAYTQEPVGVMPNLEQKSGKLRPFGCKATLSKSPSCSMVPQCIVGRCMMVPEIVQELRIRL